MTDTDYRYDAEREQKKFEEMTLLTKEELLGWLNRGYSLCRGETHRDCTECALVRRSLRALLEL